MKMCMVVLVLAVFAAGGFALPVEATGRDTNVDLIKVSTRFLENYAKAQHRAGDQDAVFIEDVVIPGVFSVTENYKGSIPATARKELFRFLVAGDSTASEDLRAIAAKLYLASPKQYCVGIKSLGAGDRRVLIQQAKDGVALERAGTANVSCP
jgi:hypothetical protein